MSSVNIPSSVTSIGGYAFSGCESLESVYMSSQIITDGAFFSNDLNLKEVHTKTLPFFINSSDFANIILSDLTLFVPKGTVHEYESAEVWKDFGTIIEVDTIVLPQTEAVDLGLSVKWATFNVGASYPEQFGGYFAWGETELNTTYDWSTYKYGNGSTNLTKYNTNISSGTVDNKTTLDPEDDVAHVKWGGSWRMPTRTEFDELRSNCTWTWTTMNGVKGYKVTSKKSGYTNRSIFLSAAGYRGGSSLFDAGSYGHYWSGSLVTDFPYYAWDLYFDSDDRDMYNSIRYYGPSVRPVLP